MLRVFTQALRASLLCLWIACRFLFKRAHFTWILLVRIGTGRIIRLRHMVCCWECFKRKFHIIDLRSGESLGKW